MTTIKAISLWQPWATLIALGVKTFETRSWPTSYRGLLVIHAAKTRSELDICTESPFREALSRGGYESTANLPLGAAVCVARLVAVYRTEQIVREISTLERAFGNYQPGRYAWKLEQVRRFEDAIPARGAQGLWDWMLPLPAGFQKGGDAS